jgi:hypothetical protein
MAYFNSQNLNLITKFQHIFIFENVVIRTVMGEKKKVYTKSLKKEIPHFEVHYLLI